MVRVSYSQLAAIVGTFTHVFLSPSSRIGGFLLAKDSLMKSSHASHPIAGQGAAAWRGSAHSQYESVSNPEKLWANVTKAF